MVNATFVKDSKDNIIEFRILGHAGFAEHGSDIVCAAVSVLALNTINSIEKFSNSSFKGEADDGLVRFEFISDIDTESSVLVNSLLLGLQSIEEEYGTKYIKIRFEEV